MRLYEKDSVAEYCYGFCLRFGIFQVADIGSMLGMCCVISYFYIFEQTYMLAQLTDRFWVMLFFMCYEIVIEVILSFLIPILLKWLRPEFSFSTS